MATSKLTITEALAEIKTIGKRIAKKHDFIKTYSLRQENVRDPLVAQGGSVEVLKQEMQGMHDLERRVVAIRNKIQASNLATMLTIGEQTMCITDWLTWRKDIAPHQANFLTAIRTHVEQVRTQARSKGVTVGAMSVDTKPTDIVVNIDERAFAQVAEQLETTLGTLDGKLSLLNATTTIEV